MYTSEEEIKSKSTKLGSWFVGDPCSKDASHLEGGQAAGTWDERVKRSQVDMLGRMFFECFRFKSVFGRRGNDFR